MQFLNHPTDAQRAELTNAGIELLAYKSGYAWTARGTSQALLNAGKLPFVRTLARIDPRDKLHLMVYLEQTPPYALAADGRTRFSMLAFPGTTSTALQAEISAMPGLAALPVVAGPPSVLGPRFEVVARANQAQALAALESCAFIEHIAPPVSSRDSTTDSSSNITQVRDSGPKLDGTGVTVAVREVGKPEAHVDFIARTQYIDNDGDQSNPGNFQHATEVVGQIASNGVNQPDAKGVAPNTNILVYSLADSSFGTADIKNAATRGARLSNHSYGPTGIATFGDYQTISADWDGAIHDNNLICFFAGNEESDPTRFKHIDFFVGMKNGLCIEASSSSANAGPPPTDGSAFFAKYGPMNDSRVKPDLVAFGDNVTLDVGTNSVTSNTGTSFSTPAATGVGALVFQHFKNVMGTEPSAAMTKAILCESASDLGPPGPDAVYGFGIVNAAAAVALINLRNNASSSPFAEGQIGNGLSQSFTVDIPPNYPFLKATLCWMDPPGDPATAKALVNDLDLLLIDPNGNQYFPYSLNAAAPMSAATNTAANTVDPIEQTFILNPVAGTWTVKIIGSNVPLGPQAFAFCFDAVLSRPLIAIAQASPISGASPLTVTFSGAASVGNIVKYDWNFGDGTSGTGQTIDHTYTFPAPPSTVGNFTATLTVTDFGGSTSSATVTITVNKPMITVFPAMGSGRVNLGRSSGNQLQLTMIVPDLVRTMQQAREAVRDGVFEGKVFNVKAALAGAPPQPLFSFLVDRHASQVESTEQFKLDLRRGAITMRFKTRPFPPLRDMAVFFRTLGIIETVQSPYNFTLHVEVETDNAIYQADYHLTYVGKLGTGSIK
jgi:hypothetical protein